ncbi:MAG: nitroreductase family deazaflavin-dependent oxidoreductase [Isosphaeraceae bacterium]
MHPLIATSTGPAGLVIHPYTQLVPMTAFDRIVGLRLLAAHQFIYELSGGRIGEQLGRVHMLLLHTTGRKTGRPRTAALLYHRDRDCYVVVGSKGGSDTPPAWLLNLKAIPDVEVQIGTRRFQAKARVASSEEKRRLWPEVTTLWPQYDRYQSQTGRAIPLVILKPQSSC